MDKVSDENVQMILAMGFPSESEVRKALVMAKNDLSDAVAILTNEPPSSQYHTVEDMDVDLGNKKEFGPYLPPKYSESYGDGYNGDNMALAPLVNLINTNNYNNNRPKYYYY